MVEVIGIVEDIGQAEGVEGIVVGSQTGCRNLGHGDNAGLQLLKILVFAAELAVGEDLDLDAPSVFSATSSANWVMAMWTVWVSDRPWARVSTSGFSAL